LKTVLVAVAFFALGCALVAQRLTLADAEASLSRYESSIISTSLDSDEFRIIPRVVIDTDNCKVVTYRIETKGNHSAAVRCDGDSNRAAAIHDTKNNLHFSEVTILIDHTKAKNSLKLMPKVGGAQGYAVMNVSDDFSLNDAVKLHREEGVHRRDEDVELFRLDDRSYTLSIEP
jgi:hypothetical protein